MCVRVNITLGTLEERLFLSGLFTVGDVSCCCCRQVLGWNYVTSPSLLTHNRSSGCEAVLRKTFFSICLCLLKPPVWCVAPVLMFGVSLGQTAATCSLLTKSAAIFRCSFQEVAREESQKYKEGKIVLERYRLLYGSLPSLSRARFCLFVLRLFCS